MPASMPLASLEALKLYLGIPAGDVSQDGLLENLIAWASERIESHCRRAFKLEELAEDLDGTGTPELVLSRRPVVALSSIKVDAGRRFAEATALNLDDVAVAADAGVIVYLCGIFPKGISNVRVEYEAGYSSPPDDVALACVKLAASWYAHARSGADGLRREALGDYSAEYAAAALPEDVTGVLERYREHTI